MCKKRFRFKMTVYYFSLYHLTDIVENITKYITTVILGQTMDKRWTNDGQTMDKRWTNAVLFVLIISGNV